jgi:hypothetical protein
MPCYKTDVEAAQARMDAWWHHDVLDRPVVQITAPRAEPVVDPVPEPEPQTQAALIEWFTDPARVIPRNQRRLANTYFGGEAFPVMFPVSIGMVAITAAYLGCPYEIIDTHTAWAHPIVDEWAERPTFAFDPENVWWQRSERLLKAAVAANDGYFIGNPDFNGPTEILARVRGTEELALDFYDAPSQIKPALAEINQAWYDLWQAATAISHQAGGYFFMMRMWSDRPAVDLQSDFSCMMSEAMFDDYFLPFIAQQTEWVDRTIYHLDGPGAIRHLDSLLDLPDLDGIQWVPGAGADPAPAWIPLLQRIQEAGKLVYTYCDKAYARTMFESLDPEGLLLSIHGCENEGEARAILDAIPGWSKS